MRHQGLLLTLLQDAVFSERAATVDAHRGLDYIPGGALLGAAARCLYADCSREDSYLAFHSGKVRFADGLPVTPEGELAFPLPACWHTAKGTSAFDAEGRLRQKEVVNLHQTALPSGGQPQPVRGGYITPSGRRLRPRRWLRMKTAIDPATGRAMEAQLFGYEAIAAGSCFYAAVAADDDVSEALFEAVVAALKGRELRLGRSRTAEYGAVRCEAAASEIYLPAPDRIDRRLTLWLLSDLAMVDAAGCPSLEPAPEDLGLPSGRLSHGASFITARRYAPYNGYLRCHDVERMVIAQGSVLTFELDHPPDAAAITGLQTGAGLFREAGLGRMWVNSPLLQGDHPQPQPAWTVASPAEAPTPREPKSQYARELLEHLDLQAQGQRRGHLIEDRLRTWRKEAEKLYQAARLLSGQPPGVRCGPSPSQWGRVYAAAIRTDMSAETLKTTLFQGQDPEGKDAVCTGREWELETGLPKEKRSFRTWIQACAEAEGLPSDAVPEAIGRLAAEARAVARAAEGGAEEAS